ncbi:nitrate- and nitrite sensing domain-containing protein, partial [Streptomyces sp. NPDC054841]
MTEKGHVKPSEPKHTNRTEPTEATRVTEPAALSSPAFPQRLARLTPGWRTIRGRVAVVLAVPTCLLLVLTGLAVADRGTDWAAARETRDRVDVVLGVQALVHELQRERGLTNGLLGGADEYRDDLAAQRERSDSARAGLTAV